MYELIHRLPVDFRKFELWKWDDGRWVLVVGGKCVWYMYMMCGWRGVGGCLLWRRRNIVFNWCQTAISIAKFTVIPWQVAHNLKLSEEIDIVAVTHTMRMREEGATVYIRRGFFRVQALETLQNSAVLKVEEASHERHDVSNQCYLYFCSTACPW